MSSAPEPEREVVVGLEVHVQLRTASKLFCGCQVTFGEPPNSRVCPVCLGLPGALPVLNERAFEFAMLAALALDCSLSERCAFDRKAYAYPDLPKNYQISQWRRPLAKGGRLMIDLADGTSQELAVTRLHIEEDAGRMIHGSGGARIDFNRAGTPLIEIVTAPDMRGPADAHACLKELQRILRYLDVSDGNMERGSLRCDCNVSVRDAGSEALGPRTEVKNLNSFRAVERAIAYEADRQWALRLEGRTIESQSMLWDETSEKTVPLRNKETSEAYRYMPEPDLPDCELSRDHIAIVRGRMAELPRARRERFTRQYGLPAKDAAMIAGTRKLADYYEAVCAASEADPKLVANWLQPVLRYLNDVGASISQFPVSAERLGQLIDLISSGRFNKDMGRSALRRMIDDRTVSAAAIAADLGEQITGEDEIAALCRTAIDDNPKPVESYRKGKTGALKALVGSVMKKTGKKANARRVTGLLEELLGSPESDIDETQP